MKMYLGLSGQALEFFYSAVLGAVYGIGLDFLRLVRLKARQKRLVCLLADALYVLVACPVLLGFVLIVTNGQMRWYVLLGILLGGMLYASMLGPTVFRILSVLSRALAWLLHALGKPLDSFFRNGYRLLLRIRNGHRKSKQKHTQKGEVLWHQTEKNESASSRA